MSEKFKKLEFRDSGGNSYWISPEGDEYYIGEETHESWIYKNHRFNISKDQNYQDALDNGWIRLVERDMKDFNFETREKYLKRVENYLIEQKFNKVIVETEGDYFYLNWDEWIENDMHLRYKRYAKREKHILQFTSSTELKQAIKLLKSLIYHRFNYEVGDNCLIFVDFNSYDSAKQLFNNKGYSVLDKKSLKQFKPKIEVNLWDFDERTSYDFKIVNPETDDEIAHLQTDEFEKGKEHGIFDIEVNPKYRRQGVATKLFNYAKNYLKNIGIQLIHSNNLSPEGMSWKQSLGNLYNFN